MSAIHVGDGHNLSLTYDMNYEQNLRIVRVENNGLSLFYFSFHFLSIFLYFLFLTKDKERQNMIYYNHTSHSHTLT